MNASSKRLKKYFWYSCGEIVLVVIGILIAIQVNNWNEDRIEQKRLHAYGRALADDLRDDIAAVTVSAYQAQNVIFRVDQLIEYLQDKTFDDLSNTDLYPYVWSMGYRPFAFTRTSLEPMKSSNALREARNQKLSRKISEYEALARHLEEDQASDSRNARDAYLATSKVINRNFRGRQDLSRYFIDALDQLSYQESVLAYASTDLYQAIKENDVRLVASNMRDVQEMTNVLISYRNDLNARPEVEFPKLIAMAEELIDLIDAEFPEQ